MLATRLSLNQSQARQFGIHARRQLAHPGLVEIGSGRVSIFEIAPALVRAFGGGGDDHQLIRTDDVDPPIGAILKPQDFLARDDAVLDDPVERAADQFGPALGAHAGGDAHFAAARAGDHPPLESLDAGTGESDFGEVKRHRAQIGATARD